MGISKKGKRMLTHKDETFYWYVARYAECDGEYDSGSDFLHIMTADKRILLCYHINEINSHSIRQTVQVLKSDALPQGGYPLFPLLEDEVITPAGVRVILNWYYEEVRRAGVR